MYGKCKRLAQSRNSSSGKVLKQQPFIVIVQTKFDCIAFRLPLDKCVFMPTWPLIHSYKCKSNREFWLGDLSFGNISLHSNRSQNVKFILAWNSLNFIDWLWMDARIRDVSAFNCFQSSINSFIGSFEHKISFTWFVSADCNCLRTWKIQWLKQWTDY